MQAHVNFICRRNFHGKAIPFIVTVLVGLSSLISCRNDNHDDNLNLDDLSTSLKEVDSTAIRDYIPTLQHYNKLLISAHASDDVLVFKETLGDLNDSIYKLGHQTELIIYFNQLLNKIEDPSYSSLILTAISGIYYNLDDPETTLEYDWKALNAAKQSGDQLKLAYIQNNLGNDLLSSDREKAEVFLDRAYQTGYKFKDSMLIAITTSNKGHLLMRQGKFEEALNILNHSKQLSRKIGDRTGIIYCDFYIGLCFFENKNFEAANIHFDSVLTGPYSLLEPKDKLEFYLKKSQTESLLQNDAEAYAFLNLRRLSRDSLQSTSKSKAIQKIMSDHFHEDKNQTRNIQNIAVASILVLAVLALSVICLYTTKTKSSQQKSFEELDQLKSRFIANISHELRTPVALILGPLQQLYNGNSKEDSKSVLGPVIRNSQRLLRLINQLLDLSKIEAGKMELVTSPINLVQFLREIASSYESLAARKRIKYIFDSEIQELLAYIDAEKMEKAVHNLLSNAFKFTKAEGEIILNLHEENHHALITVKDSGIGIPSNQLNKVFDRFYQVDSPQTRGYDGTGLGLALAKELVELHKGKISVESLEGKGTTFCVMLPLGQEHIKKSETGKMPYTREREILSGTFLGVENPEDEKAIAPVGDHPIILIVEDNADMRRYIRKTLSAEYEMLEAENGKKGAKLAEETIPDLIISDIMMPEMDGYKLCSIIKTNEVTSHIPVILLTGKTDRSSRLSGLERGADDFLSKPFDTEELKLISRNRIENSRKMRERFKREITIEPKQIQISSLNEKFLEKVLAMIESHMEDENFSIEDFSHEAGYSRMQFYRKIKALAGQTPSQFVRAIRLKRAAQLLINKTDHVTQIAYSVGFSSLSYFNKCFKDQYGMTPGQFSEGNHSKL